MSDGGVDSELLEELDEIGDGEERHVDAAGRDRGPRERDDDVACPGAAKDTPFRGVERSRPSYHSSPIL
jgi:hypothetical protein